MFGLITSLNFVICMIFSEIKCDSLFIIYLFVEKGWKETWQQTGPVAMIEWVPSKNSNYFSHSKVNLLNCKPVQPTRKSEANQWSQLDRAFQTLYQFWEFGGPYWVFRYRILTCFEHFQLRYTVISLSLQHFHHKIHLKMIFKWYFLIKLRKFI